MLPDFAGTGRCTRHNRTDFFSTPEFVAPQCILMSGSWGVKLGRKQASRALIVLLAARGRSYSISVSA